MIQKGAVHQKAAFVLPSMESRPHLKMLCVTAFGKRCHCAFLLRCLLNMFLSDTAL